ncbi:MAG: nucleotidyltransferase family protein [Candidatus Omnitrophica bacterium]|nr:nucleotidyltransferase family protein [Candidatus Omnitrophota bacterium]
MKALVLAAGYATRLYPLTKEYPKPLLKAGNKYIIDYIIEKLDKIDGIDEIFVVTNSKFIQHFKCWLRSRKSKKPITLVDDLTTSLDDRRGAIGDMHFAISKKRIKEDLVVIGGDNLFNGDLKEFLRFARAHKNAPVIGLYDIAKKQAAKNYGVAKIDENDVVIDFQEKPATPHSTLVAMCLYYFPASKLELIGDYITRKAGKHDATGFYIDWLSKKTQVYGFVFKGKWFDIGDHKFYNQAKEEFSNA